MIDSLYSDLAIFVLSLLVGFEVISKIPSTLHTPMMSGANAIHGAVVAGAIVVASVADSPAGYLLAGLAAALGAANVVGGYVVTDRMLQMFHRDPVASAAPTTPASSASSASSVSSVSSVSTPVEVTAL